MAGKVINTYIYETKTIVDPTPADYVRLNLGTFYTITDNSIEKIKISHSEITVINKNVEVPTYQIIKGNIVIVREYTGFSIETEPSQADNVAKSIGASFTSDLVHGDVGNRPSLKITNSLSGVAIFEDLKQVPAPELCPLCYSEIESINPPQTPTWQDDPTKTRLGVAGEKFIGFQNAKISHLTVLQSERESQERDLLDTSEETVFSPINDSGRFPITKQHIIELRVSTEKILDSIGETKYDYFNYDADGNYMETAQEDWHDKNLDSFGGHIKALHIEDLRHPLIIPSLYGIYADNSFIDHFYTLQYKNSQEVQIGDIYNFTNGKSSIFRGKASIGYGQGNRLLRAVSDDSLVLNLYLYNLTDYSVLSHSTLELPSDTLISSFKISTDMQYYYIMYKNGYTWNHQKYGKDLNLVSSHQLGLFVEPNGEQEPPSYYSEFGDYDIPLWLEWDLLDVYGVTFDANYYYYPMSRTYTKGYIIQPRTGEEPPTSYGFINSPKYFDWRDDYLSWLEAEGYIHYEDGAFHDSITGSTAVTQAIAGGDSTCINEEGYSSARKYIRTETVFGHTYDTLHYWTYSGLYKDPTTNEFLADYPRTSLDLNIQNLGTWKRDGEVVEGGAEAKEIWDDLDLERMTYNRLWRTSFIHAPKTYHIIRVSKTLPPGNYTGGVAIDAIDLTEHISSLEGTWESRFVSDHNYDGELVKIPFGDLITIDKDYVYMLVVNETSAGDGFAVGHTALWKIPVNSSHWGNVQISEVGGIGNITDIERVNLSSINSDLGGTTYITLTSKHIVLGGSSGKTYFLNKSNYNLEGVSPAPDNLINLDGDKIAPAFVSNYERKQKS